MKINSKIIMILLIIFSIQGCAEVSQGFQRKFHDFTSWLNELDQKIQRHIRKTGIISSSNKEGITINSLNAIPDVAKKGGTIKVIFIYDVYKKNKLNTKLKYSASLYYYNKIISQIFSEETEKDNGRWEDTFSFTVPSSAKPGKYEIRYKVAHDNGELQAATFFTVIR